MSENATCRTCEKAEPMRISEAWCLPRLCWPCFRVWIHGENKAARPQ